MVKKFLERLAPSNSFERNWIALGIALLIVALALKLLSIFWGIKLYYMTVRL